MARMTFVDQYKVTNALIASSADPHHKAILENYRLHGLLEVSGYWDEVVSPEIMVEDPEYRLSIGPEQVTLKGEQVFDFYRMLSETSTNVLVVRDQQMAVADWGFAAESTYYNYLRGRQINEHGMGEVDPDGYFIRRAIIMMIWKYDERARLIGEHVYTHMPLVEIYPIPEAEFITPEEARAELVPQLDHAREAFAARRRTLGY